MKLQELAIIFIIIILPISLLLSAYTQFQINTINKQTAYDARLTKATYDAIKAFQLNMTNSTTSDLANSKLRDLEASVNAFRNSIKTAFDLGGYSNEEIDNYIPALVYTLYDGFYIYSPYENTENGNISEYGLKPYISYSMRYEKGSDTDVVITYSLDNYISVQGIINGDFVNKSGYLIDGITYEDGIIKYNGVTIKEEQLKEYLPIDDKEYYYAKINGTKYYLVENQIQYISNGSMKVQCKEGDAEYQIYYRKIMNNDSAKQYYIEAYEFTEWAKGILRDLEWEDAKDQIIVDGNIENGSVFNTTGGIFEFNDPFAENETNIENELSSFNQHRLAVIRHKIETNLAIAISNYNEYSKAENVFQMPELKENEWDHIINNVSLISFLQGLNIGGKIYNGYTFVTNAESQEVVLEENIYILGNDGYYHKIGDKGFENVNGNPPQVEIVNRSSGRINLDFEKQSILIGETYSYYYPLKDYNASYTSIVMQDDVTTYDDIYKYVNGQSDELKEAFYTALGRERYSLYKSKNIMKYDVLLIGHASVNNYDSIMKSIVNKLNEKESVRASYIFNNNKEELKKYLNEQKDNYDLIVLHSFVWPIGNELNGILHEISNTTNLITISNDQTGLPMMNSSTTGSFTVNPSQTDLGKNTLGEISISGRTDTQAIFKFKDEVEIFYKGIYIENGVEKGEYDLIGSWQNGDNKWIHSQVSLTNDNQIKLLKQLVKYALDIK